MPKEYPPAVEPAYTTPEVNAPVQLYKGSLSFRANDKNWVGDGEIVFEWLPSPLVKFTFSTDAYNKDLAEAESGTLSGFGTTKESDVILTRWQMAWPGGKGTVGGVIQNPTVIGKVDVASSVTFHLPNFCQFRGDVIESDSAMYVGRSEFTTNGWQFTLDELRYANRKFHDQLKTQLGYGITHVGRIKKVDGAPFSVDELDSLLEPLDWYFSFCRGIRTGPIFLKGWYDDETPAWEKWRCPGISPSTRGTPWFSDSFKNVGVCLPGFLDKWSDLKKREAMILILHWYTEVFARGGGFEGGIILAQAALERLAWMILVDERKMISKQTLGGQRFPAADQLRVLISTSKIDLTIPKSLTSLAAWAREYEDCSDGPGAFVAMRNILVHGSPKRKEVIFTKSDAVYDAWCLGLWYIDLVMLRFLGYDGQYSNRLIRDGYKGCEIEDVPWVA